MPFVFVALDNVPAADKVFSDIVDAGADEADGDVMPGHAAVIFFLELVLFPGRVSIGFSGAEGRITSLGRFGNLEPGSSRDC